MFISPLEEQLEKRWVDGHPFEFQLLMELIVFKRKKDLMSMK